MPTYEYECLTNRHRFEVKQSFTDDALTACQVCEEPVRKVFSAAGIVFKGSGYYVNDTRPPEASANGGSGKADGGSATGSGGSGSGSTADSGSSGSDASSKGSSTKGSSTGAGSSTGKGSGAPAKASSGSSTSE